MLTKEAKGKQLYECYQQACLHVSSCLTDGWDTLDDNQKAEWIATAEEFAIEMAWEQR